MPFTFLAHQAPVVALKMFRPRWFNGTALAIGSMAPDLPYYVLGTTYVSAGHTLLGQFTICLPVTLVLVWIVRNVLARPLTSHLPELKPFHLRDYGAIAGTPPTTDFWARVVVSSLLGSFSHVTWDAFTHASGLPVQHVAFLRQPVGTFGGATVHVFRLLQHVSTIVGGAVCVYLLYRIGRNRLVLRWTARWPPAAGAPVTAWSHLVFWNPVVLGALVGISLGVWRAFEREYFWQDLVIQVYLMTVAATFVGLCVGSLLASRKPAAVLDTSQASPYSPPNPRRASVRCSRGSRVLRSRKRRDP